MDGQRLFQRVDRLHVPTEQVVNRAGVPQRPCLAPSQPGLAPTGRGMFEALQCGIELLQLAMGDRDAGLQPCLGEPISSQARGCQADTVCGYPGDQRIADEEKRQ